MTAAQPPKHMARQTERRERAAQRALARSAVYRLLSQSLIYPTAEALNALRDIDLPAAVALAAAPPDELPALLEQLGRQLRRASIAALQEEYRSIFPHVESGDCPPHEAAYTAQNIFQETQELSDLAGFFRRVWSLGKAGVEVPLTVYRDGRTLDVRVTSGDRNRFLKGPSLH